VDVAELFRPGRGARGVDRIVVQKVAIGTQVGAAAAGVADDRVEIVGVEKIELPAGERAGGATSPLCAWSEPQQG
jgi:hypothetical protein